MSINQELSSLSMTLRKLSNEIENTRKQYIEEVQRHNATKRVLNYVMREIKEVSITSDFNKDITLTLDTVMFDIDTVNTDSFRAFYSIEELEKGIKEFESFNNYNDLLETVERYKKRYEEV